MIRIGQNDLDTNITQILRSHGLYRALSRDRHKSGGGNSSMHSLQYAKACTGSGIGLYRAELKHGVGLCTAADRSLARWTCPSRFSRFFGDLQLLLDPPEGNATCLRPVGAEVG